MARYKGKDGAIEIGGVSVGEVESFDIEMTVNEIDVNVMGSDWTDVCAGQKSASGSVSVFTDPSSDGQRDLSEGDTIALTLFPVGQTTGLLQIAGNFMITSVGYSTAVGDLVKTSYNYRNQGEVTRSLVA